MSAIRRAEVPCTEEQLVVSNTTMKGVDKLQMSLSEFKNRFGFKNTVAYELVRSKGFPAYKVKGGWYVDIPAYYQWREAYSHEQVIGRKRHA